MKIMQIVIETPLRPGEDHAERLVIPHRQFTFLGPYTGIDLAAELYPVHGFTSGIQAKNMVIRLTDVFYSTYFGLADSSHTVFLFERQPMLLWESIFREVDQATFLTDVDDELENWHHRIAEKRTLIKLDHPRCLPAHFFDKNGLPVCPDSERIIPMPSSILAATKH